MRCGVHDKIHNHFYVKRQNVYFPAMIIILLSYCQAWGHKVTTCHVTVGNTRQQATSRYYSEVGVCTNDDTECSACGDTDFWVYVYGSAIHSSSDTFRVKIYCGSTLIDYNDHVKAGDASENEPSYWTAVCIKRVDYSSIFTSGTHTISAKARENVGDTRYIYSDPDAKVRGITVDIVEDVPDYLFASATYATPIKFQVTGMGSKVNIDGLI